MIRLGMLVLAVAVACGMAALLGCDATQFGIVVIFAVVAAQASSRAGRRAKHLGGAILVTVGLVRMAQQSANGFMFDDSLLLMWNLRFHFLELPVVGMISGLAMSLLFHEALAEERLVRNQIRQESGGGVVSDDELAPVVQMPRRQPANRPIVLVSVSPASLHSRAG
jgi:hypothetical protein